MEQYTKSNVSETNIESNSFLSHGFDFFEEHFGTGLGNSENAKTKNDFNYTNDSAKDFNDDERTGKKRKAEKIRSNDEELNSDDDDSDDLVARQSPSDDFVVCHYERIARIKEKDTWRVKLGPGIMHVGGRDKVFSASDGYFKWGE